MNTLNDCRTNNPFQIYLLWKIDFNVIKKSLSMIELILISSSKNRGNIQNDNIKIKQISKKYPKNIQKISKNTLKYLRTHSLDMAFNTIYVILIYIYLIFLFFDFIINYHSGMRRWHEMIYDLHKLYNLCKSEWFVNRYTNTIYHRFFLTI